MSNEFTKHHIEGAPFNAVLHHFTAPDVGGPHDHPWGFTVHVLKGGYIEKVYNIKGNKWTTKLVKHKPGDLFKIKATHIHEIVEVLGYECWTLVLPKEWERDWGFWKFNKDGITFHKWFKEEFILQQ